MAYRGGAGGGGGPMGGFRKQGRSSPYSRNGGGGHPRDTPRNSGGNRKGWRDGQSFRKRELTAVSEGNSDKNNESTPQKMPTTKDIPAADGTPTATTDGDQLHTTPSINNSIPDRNVDTPRPENSDMTVSGKSAETPRSEKKSYVKSRLFVGNLPREMRESEVKVLFEEHGEVNEVFVSKDKMYGFVRMVYRSDAEKAVQALNGKVILGRDIKVRFAASNSSVKVSNLHPTVSNELLEEAFSQFGDVEKAVVVTDERGKSLGHGIVDFSRKGFAQAAIRRCTDEHFLLTKSPMPVVVTEYIRDNDEDGQPEKTIPKNNTYRVERELGPRFADPGTLEYAVASQWKSTYESEKRQREALELELRQSRQSVIQDMETLREQHQTELIRQELAHHQQEQLRLVQELRMRQGSLGGLGGAGGAGGGFMDQSGGGGAPGFPPPVLGMDMNQQDTRNAPQFDNPPLLGAAPGGAPGLNALMGLAGGGPAAVPLHVGGIPSSSRPQDNVPASLAQVVTGVPPPPLMGQWPGANQGAANH